MLKKNYRFPSSHLFSEIFKEGELRENKFFEIFYKKNNLKHPRFGIIVSSKVIPLAVERNSFKRTISQFLNNYANLCQEGVDLIILAKKGVREASSEELEEALKDLLVSIS